MVAQLAIVDERFGPAGAERRPGVRLRLVSERVTAREVLRRRIETEAETLNADREAADELVQTRSLIIPVEAGSAESRLQAFLPRRRRRRRVDVDAEMARATAAFDQRRFILLFDDRQVEDLDEVVLVGPDSQAVFLYLTPLRGG